ncbi:unnamed protein product [Polarella glacialis]|uniref:RING-CH-type domain-containing protein n=1 Tax=Polarella glacialis TaxID=89957 RepID=A0A813L605_POLGL|nr:unnamed protein product [Polarella glacialis]
MELPTSSREVIRGIAYSNIPLTQSLLREGLLSSIDDGAVCRVCTQNASEECELLAPCHCDGSVKWICRDCLDKWRGQDEWSRFRCELCGCAYVYHIETASPKAVLDAYWTSGKYGCKLLAAGFFLSMLQGGLIVLVKSPLLYLLGIGLVAFCWVAADLIASTMLLLKCCDEQAYIGLLGSIVRRLFGLNGFNDITSLYKAEWQALVPFELESGRQRQPLSAESEGEMQQPVGIRNPGQAVCAVVCAISLMAVGASTFPFLWGPMISAWMLKHIADMMALGFHLTVFASLYLASLFILHSLAFVIARPHQLRRDDMGNALVRSLLPSERH